MRDPEICNQKAGLNYNLHVNLRSQVKRHFYIFSFLTKRRVYIIITPRGGEVASRRAHNPKIGRSNRPPANW